jgi:hypothetical protein
MSPSEPTMIDFACTRCHEKYSVPADQAGSDLQCTRCGLLLSVPLPSDLANLNDDGTHRIAEAVVPAEAGRLHTLARVFGRNRIDESGEEIDNRTLAETLELAPITGPPTRLNPQYDPETGELVRPIQVAEQQLPPIADVASPDAPRTPEMVLGYRHRGAAVDEPRRVAPKAVKWELFQPINVFVMGVLVMVHVLFNISFVVVNAGLLFFVAAPLVMFFMIISHYGNVIDEIGPSDMDELPRPLRTVSWYDDLWSPFCHMFIGLFLGGFPFIFVLFGMSDFITWRIVLGALGATAVSCYFMPAVLLALHTSGTIQNARPDRILGVIRQCGASYLPVAAYGFIALITYFFGMFGTLYSLLKAMGGISSLDLGVWGTAPVTYAVLMVGIYFAHLFSWRVGLLYRMYQPKFPWVHQEHVRRERDMSRARLSAKEKAALIRAKQAPTALRRQTVVEGLQGRQHM